MGVEVAIVVLAVLLGALIGRWWSIALALPAALVGGSVFSFEGFTGAEVALLLGVASAVGLALGTGLRKAIGGARHG